MRLARLGGRSQTTRTAVVSAGATGRGAVAALRAPLSTSAAISSRAATVTAVAARAVTTARTASAVTAAASAATRIVAKTPVAASASHLTSAHWIGGLGAACAVLGVTGVASVAAEGASNMAVDAASGVEFPRAVMANDGARDLLGTGVRIKYYFVKIYAVGVYINVDKAAEAAGGLNASGEALVRAAASDANVGMTIRIVMTRSVDSKTFVDSVNDALVERMKERGGDVSLVEEFKAIFPPEAMEVGAEIVFDISGGNFGLSVTLPSSGKTVTGEIASPQLCESMMDVYVGASPVSSDAKANVIAGADAVMANKNA